MTATAVSNNISDITGLLNFFWLRVRHLSPSKHVYPDQDAYLQIGRDMLGKYKGNAPNVPAEDEMDVLSTLNPKNFKKVLNKAGGATNIDAGSALLQPILVSLVIRRVSGDTISANGKQIELGDAISMHRITTKEIIVPPVTRQRYDWLYASLINPDVSLPYHWGHYDRGPSDAWVCSRKDRCWCPTMAVFLPECVEAYLGWQPANDMILGSKIPTDSPLGRANKAR